MFARAGTDGIDGTSLCEAPMAQLTTVARYLLEKSPDNRLSVPKLERLLYFCQIWHVIHEKRKLFRDKLCFEQGKLRIEAYRNRIGPYFCATLSLFPYKGKLLKKERQVIDMVYDNYNKYSSEDLGVAIRYDFNKTEGGNINNLVKLYRGLL